MTIIPLLPQPDPEPYYRLLPAAWCYCCGFVHQVMPARDCLPGALPEPPKAAWSRAAMLACDSLTLPELLGSWAPEHVETARQIAAVLNDWAGIAERLNARVAV